MRTHGDYTVCQLWPYGPAERNLIRSGTIAVARFESIQRNARTMGWLDLTFADGDQTTVVNGILVDPVALSRNDPVAFIFPRRSGVAIDAERAWELCSFLLPQVRMLIRAHVVPLEAVVRFRECAAFERARAAGELGAAPLTIALTRMAPWVAAARLAGSGPIAIAARGSALGAAVARRFGVAVSTSSEGVADPWYRTAAGAADGEPSVTVAEGFADGVAAPIRVALDGGTTPEGARVVVVPKPLPMEAVLTFDPDDAPEVARFAIVAERRPAAPVPRGPSRPRSPAKGLTFAVRDDFITVPDADTDELEELAVRARAAGFTIAWTGLHELDGPDAGAVPVACGDLGDPAVAGALERLAGRQAPFGVLLSPASPIATWYETALSRVVVAEDDELLESATRAFDTRTLDAGGSATPLAPLPPDPAAVAALASAALIVPALTDGSAELRETYGLDRTVLHVAAPLVAPDDGDDDVGAICGYAPYLFAHAPAVPRSGLLALALALRGTSIPCVIATTIGDLQYVTDLRRIVGPRAIVLTGATPGLVNALYRHATIFVDPSLRPRGASRIVRAARGGALPVVFAESPLARLLPAESIVPRTAIADLRYAIARLWQSPKLAHHRSLVRSMFAPTLGDQRAVDTAAEELLDRLAVLCS